MAGGCPALAANNSGMRDAISDGHNGWLLDGFAPGRSAERILSLLAAGNARRIASDTARSNAGRYDLARLTSETVAWYESLV